MHYALPKLHPLTHTYTIPRSLSPPLLQDDDEKVRSALLEFSYNLAINNMDEAFRAVKAIKSTAVWGNMAHLCIKNKRLDVAGDSRVLLPI
jgi:hypothetical protein